MPCNHRTKCRHLADSFDSACSGPLEMQHKKWFQVIRVATPLLASMLGVERCGARETGGRLVMLAADSSGAAGLDWGGPLPVSPVRSRHLRAVFHWPMTMVAGQPSWGLCSRPASSTPRWTLLRSVRPAAPRHCRFAPAQAFSTPRARCPDFCPSIPVSLRLFASPSGCRPLRIAAFDPIWRREARFPKLPDLPWLPATRYFCCGSWLWVRCDFGG